MYEGYTTIQLSCHLCSPCPALIVLIEIYEHLISEKPRKAQTRVLGLSGKPIPGFQKRFRFGAEH